MPLENAIGRRAVLGGVAMTLAGTGVLGTAVGRPDRGAERSGKFQLDGTAEIVREKASKGVDFVTRIDTRPDAVDPENELFGGSIGRHLAIDQLPDLEGKLGLSVRVTEGHTILSAPRVTLFVDVDEDEPVAIHGFNLQNGPSANGPGLDPDDGWTSLGYTGDGTRWNDSAIGGGTFDDWSEVLDNWSPDYGLLEGWIIDDSYWVDGGSVVDLDHIQLGDAIFEGPADTVGTSSP